MTEFINRNLEKTEPEYFYRVSQFATTFGTDMEEYGPFSHFEDFKGRSLHVCKKNAEEFYYEKLEGLEKEGSKYYLPFEGPVKFEFGKNAAFSITLYLVEYYNDDEYYEYPLIGEDIETILDSREVETAVLKERG